MRAYVIPKDCRSLDQLRLVERPDPEPGPGQVLIRIRAASLNYRDHMIVTGDYFGMTAPRELTPCSDLGGEVIGVGAGVTRVKVGDRVTATFSQADPNGPASGPQGPLGLPHDGALAEQIVLHEDGVLPMPPGYSFEEAACLPCAGVTAWNTLMIAGRPIRPGDTVVALGTGGVSIWALQLAHAAGARVIITSSSDEKVERARALGASDGINYRNTPEWDQEVMRLTGGRGADCVIEVGGEGTLARSFRALAPRGKVGLIGVLAGSSQDLGIHTLMFKQGTLHGIMVGDRGLFEQLNRAVTADGIKPVIDGVFAFEDARTAFERQQSGAFMGKIVVTI